MLTNANTSCARVRERALLRVCTLGAKKPGSVFVCVNVSAGVRACVCEKEREREGAREHAFTSSLLGYSQ